MNKPQILRTALAALAVSFGLASAGAAEPNARDLMKRNEEAKLVSGMTATVELKTGSRGATERIKRFRWWRKLTTDGKQYRTMTRFDYPPENRGQGILFVEHADRDPDVSMYLPSFKKVRRVQRQDQGASFMGSEFSYADLTTPRLDDYRYQLARTEKCGGVTCYVVESTPANASVRDRTGYARTVNWVRGDNFMVVRTEYFDLKNALLKRMDAEGIVELDPRNHRWLAKNLRIENLQSRRSTTIEFGSAALAPGLADSIFTVQNLENGK